MDNINYKLNNEYEYAIIELYKKAKEINLGNIMFGIYDKEYGEVDVVLTEYLNHWEVVVKNAREVDGKNIQFLDVYHVSNNEFLYKSTESYIL
ncbi:MAG: hypothetical protein ACRC7N_14600 [Clostridium sp.]